VINCIKCFKHNTHTIYLYYVNKEWKIIIDEEEIKKSFISEHKAIEWVCRELEIYGDSY